MTGGLGPALTPGQILDQAVVFKDERASHAALKTRAEAFAQGLRALGIGPNDHVVLWKPKRVE